MTKALFKKSNAKLNSKNYSKILRNRYILGKKIDFLIKNFKIYLFLFICSFLGGSPFFLTQFLGDRPVLVLPFH
jgi:hypothetical protein